jgi:flagellin-like protein
MKNKRGQSELIVTILLILIVIVLIVIFWNVIYSVIQKGAEKVELGGFVLEGDLDYYIDEVAVVKVHRGSSIANISGIKIVFEDVNGATYIYEDKSRVPRPLETLIYAVTKAELTPPINDFKSVKKISLYYIYSENRLSRELASEKVNNDSYISTGFDKNYIDADDDGFGNPNTENYCARGTENCVPIGLDCDDNDDEIHPGVEESCDGEDNDCDTKIDEGITPCLKAYTVTSTTRGDYWVGENGCNWIDISSYPKDIINQGINHNFFNNGAIDKFRICRNGYIIVADSSGNLASCSTNINDLNNQRAIAPYWVENEYYLSARYCIQNKELFVRWEDYDASAETRIKSEEIKFSYSKEENLCEIRLNYGNGYTKNRIKEISNGEENTDYQFNNN